MKRKRKTTSRKRRTVSNPRRRRASVAMAPRHARKVTRRRTRRHNPTTHLKRRHRRRRNPAIKGLLVGGLYAAAGAMANSLIAGFVPVRANGLLGLGVQLGTAYITALAGEKIIPGPANQNAFALGAAASVGKSAIDWFLGLVRGPLSGALATTGVQVGGQEGGVSGLFDIVPFDASSYGMGDAGMGDIIEMPQYISENALS